MGVRSPREGARRLGEILIEEGLVRPETVDEVLKKQKRLGQLLVEEGIISLEELCAALHKQSEELDRAAKLFDDTSRYFKSSPLFKDGLDKVIGSMTDILLFLDTNATVRSVNSETLELLGYEEAEIVGQPVKKLFMEEKAEPFDDMANFQPFTNIETELLQKDGGKLPVLLSCSVMLDEKGLARGIACVAKDISERKRAEDALRRTNEEIQRQIAYINKAQEQLIHAEKLASVGLLTADVSHEILNPLNVITMRLQLMMDDPATPPEVARHLRILDDQANRIVKISQDLLSFARRRPPERRKLDINTIAKRTLDLLEHKLRKENIAVELELDSTLPQVLADEDQLQQVVFNLLTNARDAMPVEGSMTLSTNIIEDKGKAWVELRVEDSGEGIAPEHLERLFDPFFTTKAEGEGTGLGLSICQNIVKAHGGSIWAERSPKGGAAFVIRLGAEEAPMAKKIMVVDDEPLICELLQEFLVDQGYRTIIAQSGEEALKAYMRYRPDVVLLDVLMPGKSGLEVLRELKALDPNVAVVLVTAVREKEVIEQAKAEGVLDYINKPIDKDHLGLTLRNRVSVLNSLN